MFAHWVLRQSRRRLFLIFWGSWSAMEATVQIGVTLGFVAYGHPFHAPPWWMLPLDVLTSAPIAAFMTSIVRRSAQVRLTETSR